MVWSGWGCRRDGIISEKCTRKWNLTFKLVFPYYLLVVKRIIFFFLLSCFKLFHFAECMWNSSVMLDFDVDDRKPSCFSMFNFEPFALLSLLTHSLVVFPNFFFYLNNVFILQLHLLTLIHFKHLFSKFTLMAFIGVSSQTTKCKLNLIFCVLSSSAWMLSYRFIVYILLMNSMCNIMNPGYGESTSKWIPKNVPLNSL